MKWKSIQMPKGVEAVDASKMYGRFVLEPLERGFGITLGNALRRVLLSSIQGAAITAVRLEGILHEFSTISGVYQDVAEICLNLKKVRLKLSGEAPKMMHLKAAKKGKLLASHIETGGDVEILNPDQFICELTEETKFSAELEVGFGRGYLPAEQNKRPGAPVGTIFLDSLFSPVYKVNYQIENTRLGQRVDYERLIIEIWTDGGVTAEEALSHAGQILNDHLSVLIKTERPAQADEVSELDEDTARMRNLLKTRVEELELSVRSANCLRAAGIDTLGDLVRRSEPEMLEFRNFGRKSLTELHEVLNDLGLSFGMDISRYLPEGNN
jgi:DNA-directed RNA polymerase subunit alpha